MAITKFFLLLITREQEMCPRDVVANVLDWDIIVSEFDLQSHYYDPFQPNTFMKVMNPL